MTDTSNVNVNSET